MDRVLGDERLARRRSARRRGPTGRRRARRAPGAGTDRARCRARPRRPERRRGHGVVLARRRGRASAAGAGRAGRGRRAGRRRGARSWSRVGSWSVGVVTTDDGGVDDASSTAARCWKISSRTTVSASTPTHDRDRDQDLRAGCGPAPRARRGARDGGGCSSRRSRHRLEDPTDDDRRLVEHVHRHGHEEQRVRVLARRDHRGERDDADDGPPAGVPELRGA